MEKTIYETFKKLDKIQREAILTTLNKIHNYLADKNDIVYVCCDCGVWSERNLSECKICGSVCFTEEKVGDIE